MDYLSPHKTHQREFIPNTSPNQYMACQGVFTQGEYGILPAHIGNTREIVSWCFLKHQQIPPKASRPDCNSPNTTIDPWLTTTNQIWDHFPLGLVEVHPSNLDYSLLPSTILPFFGLPLTSSIPSTSFHQSPFCLVSWFINFVDHCFNQSFQYSCMLTSTFDFFSRLISTGWSTLSIPFVGLHPMTLAFNGM